MLRHERNAITFLLRHLLYGAVGGMVFGVLVVVLDIAHLRSLAMESTDGILTLVLFFFGLFVTFGSLGMAAGIMGLGQDDN
jgi:hypothetical protein